MAVFLYAFREREDLMDCYEANFGCAHARRLLSAWRGLSDLPDQMPRHQASKIRSKGAVAALNRDRSGSLLDFIEAFTNRFPGCVDEYETLLTDNRIWKQRLVGVGVVEPRSGQGSGVHRADVARLRRGLGSSQAPAL
ncbi:MAG: hypothetical protein R3E83_18725 [Burkholderiaceae bacterium]